MLNFLILILMAYANMIMSPGNNQAHAAASSSQDKNIFILAGQSNMSGRGGVTNTTWDGVIPPECGPNPAILRFSADLTWVEAGEPLHKDIDVSKTCGVGPGMAFANSLLAKDPSLIAGIGLVPCAIGGTNISEWARGTELYNQLVRRAGAALQSGGRIRAILWYQGESDTVSQEDADLYKGRLKKFFSDVRNDLQSPMLPIIQVALASGQGPFVERVREAQLGIGEDVGGVRCVDGRGLELEPDQLHLTTRAQVRLGEMLAYAFLQTQTQTQTQPSPLESSSSSPNRLHNYFSNLFHRPPFFKPECYAEFCV